ncbi:hypothetical protein HK098_005138 [Nowakowskiella sp. JEL0407]|nr:hypothetical protein HK098_005138 [Nowakowskiella sp. JEL0407]
MEIYGGGADYDGIYGYCGENTGLTCNYMNDDASVCIVPGTTPSPPVRSPSMRTRTIPSPQITSVPVGGQCGGLNYNGPTICADYGKCTRVDESKSICIEHYGNLIQEGGSCFGEGCDGLITCNPKKGLTCKKVSDKLSTCQVYPAVRIGEQCKGYTGLTKCEDGIPSQCIYEDESISTCRRDYGSFVKLGDTCNVFSFCVEGAKCEKQPDQKYLCVPIATVTSSIASTTVSTVSTNTSKPVMVGYQCGGNIYVGSTICETGSECVYMDETFSICLPIPSPTTSYSPTSPLQKEHLFPLVDNAVDSTTLDQRSAKIEAVASALQNKNHIALTFMKL